MPSDSLTWDEPHPSLLPPLPKRKSPVQKVPATLVSLGIKVRDFAYPVDSVKHTNPIHAEPPNTVPTPDEPATQVGMSLQMGIEPYPWRAMHNPHWAPSWVNSMQMSSHAHKDWLLWDANEKILRCREQADLDECRREPGTGGDDAKDVGVYDVGDGEGLTMRQRLMTWRAQNIDGLKTQYPRFPLWGWNAPWTGYRLLTGTPTGKTVHEYAAQFSRCTLSKLEWATYFPQPRKPRDWAIFVDFKRCDYFAYSTFSGRKSVDCGGDSDEEGDSDDGWLERLKALPNTPSPTRRKRDFDEQEEDEETCEPRCKRARKEPANSPTSRRRHFDERLGGREGEEISAPPTKHLKTDTEDIDSDEEASTRENTPVVEATEPGATAIPISIFSQFRVPPAVGFLMSKHWSTRCCSTVLFNSRVAL
ncbi:hypothetical protein FB45DRAFT_869161 [Roridomyces roridus]|uniref:Uncharacterized protein n=1 Tax=Roridomyces roridus TaxID=1738132 RepID=A0AAD7BP25_9AGAR|nr:hypothetical protein FB45DRAFT_869161 [Roridomyces roridus]